MSVKRPAKRFTVLIEDGADELHFLCVRGHDQDGAIRQAVKRLRKSVRNGPLNEYWKDRSIKRLRLLSVFAGHAREVKKGGDYVTYA